MQGDGVALDHGAGTGGWVVHELVPVVGVIVRGDAVLVVLGARRNGSRPLGDNSYRSGGLDVLYLETHQAVWEGEIGGLGGLIQ